MNQRKERTRTTFTDIVKSMTEDVSTEGIIVVRIIKTNKDNVELWIKGKEEKCRPTKYKDRADWKSGYKE